MPLTYDGLLAEVEGVSAPGPRLNVGCGLDRRHGYVNSDLHPLPGVDVVAELGRHPLPFPDGTFSVVAARDVLEHVDDLIIALGELHRVLRPGGRLVVSTVHFTSRNVWLDPTHRRAFSVRTFDMFVPGARGVDRTYYAPFSFAAVERAHVQFSSTLGMGRVLVWDRLVEPLVNRGRALDVYELTGLSRLFPAANVLAVLRK